MTGDAELTRIVDLVANLTRAERRGEPPQTLARLGEQYGVAAPQISADLRTLTLLGENSESEWLLSLSVWQQEDRVSVSSGGPFRRPLLFSPEERLALHAALALDPEGASLARRFANLWSGGTSDPSATESLPAARDVAGMVRSAVSGYRCLELEYAGEGKTVPEAWRIEPHQIVDARGHTYVVSWCPATRDWRHFRLDRVVSISETQDRFTARKDFKPVERLADLFRPKATDPVVVRFSPRVSRWVKERYPGGRVDPADGSVTVTFPVTSEAWLVRRVLEYGPDAQVVEPRRYREAVLRAVG